MMEFKKKWTFEELNEMVQKPLLETISHSHKVFCQYHNPQNIQVCSLISIKTGGCPENCKYCTQSAYYQTSTQATPLMKYEDVLERSKKAVEEGATRICLGAAWREVRDGKQFDQVLAMIKGIAELGVEVCCTLGMLKEHQAKKLKEAGLYAYNHNLDTSERFYPSIITTRNYEDRLQTLDIVEKAGIHVCCGGILGLGETVQDRLEFLLTLCNRDPQPDSVPINCLEKCAGTPLENQPKIEFWDFLRIVAIARIVLPRSMIRLSAGRKGMSIEQQALCFLAGANSIHSGEKLLTVPNPSFDDDYRMFEIFGIGKHV